VTPVPGRKLGHCKSQIDFSVTIEMREQEVRDRSDGFPGAKRE